MLLLFIGLILSIFDMHKHFVRGMKEIFNKEVTVSSYWFILFLLDLIIIFIRLIIYGEGM